MIFRTCPGCGQSFICELDWMRETKPKPELQEIRTVVTARCIKERRQTLTTLRINVREHECGGQMYDEGVVASTKEEVF